MVKLYFDPHIFEFYNIQIKSLPNINFLEYVILSWNMNIAKHEIQVLLEYYAQILIIGGI